MLSPHGIIKIVVGLAILVQFSKRKSKYAFHLQILQKNLFALVNRYKLLLALCKMSGFY